MTILKRAEFNPENDTLYVLGDVIDRGEKHVDCIKYIMKTKNVHLLIGNHEQMMFDYLDKNDRNSDWFYNGGRSTLAELINLEKQECDKILSYMRKRPYYKTVNVNGRRYFLSHAGLNAALPFTRQKMDDLTWSREEFYNFKALPNHTCIFGHTQTYHLHYDANCAVWFDTRYNDKIDIDCGCAYGGALALLRLDDGEIFYVRSKRSRYSLNPSAAPSSFFLANKSKDGTDRKNGEN